MCRSYSNNHVNVNVTAIKKSPVLGLQIVSDSNAIISPIFDYTRYRERLPGVGGGSQRRKCVRGSRDWQKECTDTARNLAGILLLPVVVARS